MTAEELEKFIRDMSDDIKDYVFRPINDLILKKPEIRNSLNPAFPYPYKLRIGILDNCLAVEYIGPNKDEDDDFGCEGSFQPSWDIYDFLNIDINIHKSRGFKIETDLDNMSFFLGKSISYLTDYFYDITQLPYEFLMMNSFVDFSKVERPMFISNTNFFWTDENDQLKIKHIDFMEIFPLGENGEIYYHDNNGLEKFAEFVTNYKVPKYRVKLHSKLNEFIEFINLPNINEPKITAFLSENPEILQLAFGYHELNPQIALDWQFETKLDNLKPDFLPIRMDGYADIMEFKLPYLKNNAMVGKPERRHPSFEIDTAIAQLDTYNEWCSQKVNVEWLEKNKGIKVLYPRKFLIMGHSKDFSKEDRAKLRGIRDTTVFTYDEFIEMARFQLYRVQS